MLFEKDLFGNINKVEKAIEVLRYYEPDDGYWVAISGGKDSDVILELCKMAGVKFDAHHSLTTIDKPEAIYHIRRDMPEVEIISPDVPFLKKLETKGFPIRQGRWCCVEYKENGGDGRRVVTGIRKEESAKRSKRQTFEHCYKGGTGKSKKTYVHPIINWSEEDVWEFHKLRSLKHCTLYDKGAKRVGCLFCPMARHSERIQDMKDYPRYKDNFVKAFENLYERRLESGSEAIKRWNNGKEMFDWWINESETKEDKHQQLLRFEDQ